MLRTIRLLFATVIVALLAAGAAPPARALELAPPPAEPKPSLWAEIETECFGAHGTTPGIRWKAGNNTNAKHIVALFHNGGHVYDVMVEPGEVKTGALNAPQWEDTSQSFAVVWKSQDVTLAQIKPWLNCTEPELSVTYSATDAMGAPCAGPLTVTVANSGNQNAEVRILLQQAVVQHVVIQPGTSVGVEMEAVAGNSIAGTVWDHGAHEFFFGTQAVDCDEDDDGGEGEPPAPPEPPAPNDGGNDGGEPKVDDAPGEPGGTWQEVDEPEPGVVEDLPEPVIADAPPGPPDTEAGDPGLDEEITRLRGRQLGGPNEPPVSGGSSRWGGWVVLTLLAAATTLVVLHRAR
jgi:hypothetical protein